MKNKVYIVIGMHRSGTSLVAGLLHNAGIDMGEGFFREPALDNPKGFYEDTRFRDINDSILKFNQYDVKSWGMNIPSCNADKSLYGQIRGVLEDAKRRQTWGVKDPRFCLTWHLWYKGFPQDTTVVYVYRNPIAVANSLITRGNVETLSHGVTLWTIYNQRALGIRNHFETVFVNYDKVLADIGIEQLGIQDTGGLIDTALQTSPGGTIPENTLHVWSRLTKKN